MMFRPGLRTLFAHPPQLRHAFGYYLASHGHDTRAIQDYLWHRNIQHTVALHGDGAAPMRKLLDGLSGVPDEG
jgi:integrase